MKHALSSKKYMGTSYNMGVMALLISCSYFSNKTMII